jgi:heme A synthase
MTKKEYFNSEYVSPQTRNKIKAMWIMVGILAVIVLAYVVHTAVGLVAVDQTIEMTMELMPEETVEEFEIVEETFGITLFQFVTAIMKGVVIYQIVISLISILLALLTCVTKSMAAAIVMLVLNAIPMAAGGIFLLGVSIALIVLTAKVNGEYKTFVQYGPPPAPPVQQPPMY